MSDVMRSDRNRFVQFILGFLFGVIVFGVFAFMATLFLQSRHYCAGNRFSTGFTGCIPALEYAILRVASWGPSVLIGFIDAAARFTEMQLQMISAGLYGLIGAALFLGETRRSPVEIFLVIYLLFTVLLSFFILMLVLAG